MTSSQLITALPIVKEKLLRDFRSEMHMRIIAAPFQQYNVNDEITMSKLKQDICTLFSFKEIDEHIFITGLGELQKQNFVDVKGELITINKQLDKDVSISKLIDKCFQEFESIYKQYEREYDQYLNPNVKDCFYKCIDELLNILIESQGIIYKKLDNLDEKGGTSAVTEELCYIMSR